MHTQPWNHNQLNREVTPKAVNYMSTLAVEHQQQLNNFRSSLYSMLSSAKTGTATLAKLSLEKSPGMRFHRVIRKRVL